MDICHDDVDRIADLLIEVTKLKGIKQFVQFEIEQLEKFLTDITEDINGKEKELSHLKGDSDEQ